MPLINLKCTLLCCFAFKNRRKATRAVEPNLAALPPSNNSNNNDNNNDNNDNKNNDSAVIIDNNNVLKRTNQNECYAAGAKEIYVGENGGLECIKEQTEVSDSVHASHQIISVCEITEHEDMGNMQWIQEHKERRSAAVGDDIQPVLKSLLFNSVKNVVFIV